jgi:hypothetical protein
MARPRLSYSKSEWENPSTVKGGWIATDGSSEIVSGPSGESSSASYDLPSVNVGPYDADVSSSSTGPTSATQSFDFLKKYRQETDSPLLQSPGSFPFPGQKKQAKDRTQAITERQDRAKAFRDVAGPGGFTGLLDDGTGDRLVNFAEVASLFIPGAGTGVRSGILGGKLLAKLLAKRGAKSQAGAQAADAMAPKPPPNMHRGPGLPPYKEPGGIAPELRHRKGHDPQDNREFIDKLDEKTDDLVAEYDKIEPFGYNKAAPDSWWKKHREAKTEEHIDSLASPQEQRPDWIPEGEPGGVSPQLNDLPRGLPPVNEPVSKPTVNPLTRANSYGGVRPNDPTLNRIEAEVIASDGPTPNFGPMTPEKAKNKASRIFDEFGLGDFQQNMNFADDGKKLMSRKERLAARIAAESDDDEYLSPPITEDQARQMLDPEFLINQRPRMSQADDEAMDAMQVAAQNRDVVDPRAMVNESMDLPWDISNGWGTAGIVGGKNKVTDSKLWRLLRPAEKDRKPTSLKSNTKSALKTTGTVAAAIPAVTELGNQLEMPMVHMYERPGFLKRDPFYLELDGKPVDSEAWDKKLAEGYTGGPDDKLGRRIGEFFPDFLVDKLEQSDNGLSHLYDWTGDRRKQIVEENAEKLAQDAETDQQAKRYAFQDNYESFIPQGRVQEKYFGPGPEDISAVQGLGQKYSGGVIGPPELHWMSDPYEVLRRQAKLPKYWR